MARTWLRELNALKKKDAKNIAPSIKLTTVVIGVTTVGSLPTQ